jgi:hypothetical protein
MNAFEQEQRIERWRQRIACARVSANEVYADHEARTQYDRDAADADPIAEHDRIMAGCVPFRSPVVRSAEAAAGLVYKRNERALVSPAVAAQADQDGVGEMSLEELLDTVGVCLAECAAEERAERRKLQDRLRKRIAKLERRIDALETERNKVLNLPVRHVG